MGPHLAEALIAPVQHLHSWGRDVPAAACRAETMTLSACGTELMPPLWQGLAEK